MAITGSPALRDSTDVTERSFRPFAALASDAIAAARDAIAI
jgi:hypothetical protein